MSSTTRTRLASVGFALAGLRSLLESEPNARIHFGATVAVVAAGLLLRLTALEWCALVAAMSLVWLAEALNTAIETLCDLVHPEQHPLVGRAKDVAAAGVLAAAMGAAVIGVLVFGPRLWRA
ncbi:MAG: diacylglycerol kinase family protein [Gemmatimonadales bacterium]|jgi:diacylglycerol kinase (ATP)|nr:diacylglycerol kinase family protein [Gemmatimonadales bacterium]